MNSLKRLREDRCIPVSKLTKLLNVSRATYYNYESGITQPGFDILKILSDYYKVSIDYLLNNNSKIYEDPETINWTKKKIINLLEELDYESLLLVSNIIEKIKK